MFPTTLVEYQTPQRVHHRPTEETIQRRTPHPSAEVRRLDMLLPPLIAEKEGQYRMISSHPASSSDIMRLQEKLDSELEREEAREMGICPARRRLYDELFLELIRQESVACPERGRLLKLVHQESRSSLSAGVACHESAVSYGLKKCLLSGKKELSSEMAALRMRIANLHDRVRALELGVSSQKLRLSEEESRSHTEWEKEENETKEKNNRLLKEMLDFIEFQIDDEN